MIKKYTVESFRKQGIPILQTPPKGWRRIGGASTAPRGYEWWGHGQRFEGTYRHALVKEED